MKQTLFKLLNTYGGTGREDDIREVIAEMARPCCDEMRVDAMGNLICVRRGAGEGTKRIMVSAHMDHIGFVVLDADKRHLDWKKAAEDFGIQELLKKYRRFRRKPKLTEREKLVITAYTGYVLEGTAGKVVDFVEQELGHSIQTPEPPAVPVVVEVRRALQEEFCEICRKHHIFDYI